MTKKVTPAVRRRVFNKAISLLKTKGWTQGIMKYRGRYCAIGAVREAARLLRVPALRFYVNTVLMDYNDRPHRRRSDVVKRLASLAKLGGK